MTISFILGYSYDLVTIVNRDADCASSWRRLLSFGRYPRCMRGETGDSSELTPEYWEGRAEDCYVRGKLEAALACWERVRTLDPRSRSAALGRAFILILLEKPVDALGALDEALAMNADDAELWRYRGSCLGILERYGEAVESFDRVLAGSPQSPISRGVTLCNRAGMLVHMRNFEEALECIDLSLEAFPDLYESWNQKGLILSELGRSEEALQCFDTALSIAPHNIISLHCRGAALEKLGRWDEALASYDAVLKAAPEFAVSRERKEALEKAMGEREPGQGDRTG
jgi:tetratricopeptide (TPR) repeat protein